MALEDDIALFEKVPTLAALGKQALRVLAIGAEPRKLQAGAVLYYAGDAADGGYLVQRGELLIEPGTRSGGEEYSAGPGTLLGELSLIADTISSDTAIAREPTVVIRISRSLFHKTLQGYPAAARRLRDMMAGRLERSTGDLKAMRERMMRKDKR
jgi:CRP-like cAMP-binding protein